MSALDKLAAWLNVRPHELRDVTLSFFGAFLAISFLILARSLREALYLAEFDIKTLPYITAAVAILSIPAVGFFSRTLAHRDPRHVLRDLMILLAAGLAILWPFATRNPGAIVAFYLWTALGTLLLTSGFWVMISEYFPVRSAKRLYGLIGAGGTAGAMVMGNSLVWLTDAVSVDWLIPGLILMLGLFFIVQRLLPHLEEPGRSESETEESRSSLRESLTLSWRSDHLRTTAMIVFAAAVATTILDYQFKELAQANMSTKEDLTSFFGAFYGWTGAASLVIQLVVVSRFIGFAGLGAALAILPLVLVLGSVGMLIVPSLIMVTGVRGADNTLRRSIYRSALEVTYVPIPSLLRRKTKTFIDSVVDSIAEGIGAALILGWVAWLGLGSRWLSIHIIIFSTLMLVLSRRMGRQYFATVTQELKGGAAADLAARATFEGRDLLSGTFTRLDIRSLLDAAEDRQEDADAPVARGEGLAAHRGDGDELDVVARLESADLRTVVQALEDTSEWEEIHIAALMRLLARDAVIDRAVAALIVAGDRAVPHLARLLTDEGADFVIRRRIPRVLARMGGVEADDAVLDALSANRFEIRYRAAMALVRRRRRELPSSARDARAVIWRAIRAEVGRERPVWELQKLLDEPEGDDLVARRVGARGELSLEHTFRLLSLVLEPEVVKAAFHGVMLDDEKLKSFALEYLEQVLPDDVRSRLWPFIGDISEYQRDRSLRSLDDVVSDLMTTGATLFADATDREALKRILEDREE